MPRIEVSEGRVQDQDVDAVVDVETVPGLREPTAEAASPSVRGAPARIRVALPEPALADGPSVARACRVLIAAADAMGATSVAVPPLGTGAGGVAVFSAAHAAVRAVRDGLAEAGGRVELVRFAVPDPEAARVFRDALGANALVRRPPRE